MHLGSGLSRPSSFLDCVDRGLSFSGAGQSVNCSLLTSIQFGPSTRDWQTKTATLIYERPRHHSAARKTPRRRLLVSPLVVVCLSYCHASQL